MRPEARVNEDFSPSLADDMWQVRQAARARVQGWWGPASVHVSLQHTYTWGGEDTGSKGPTNRTGLFQGYFELAGMRGDVSGFIRAGRQWFGIGSQRIIAYRYWQPGNLSIDALRMEGTAGKLTVGALASILDPPSTFTVADANDPDQEFEVRSQGTLMGAGYVFIKAHKAANIDAYAYGWNEGPNEAQPNKDRRFGNYGLRLHGKPIAGLSYDAEGYLQSGTVDGRDHLGWAAIGQLRYEFQRSGVRPGLGVTYEIHSGEACQNEPDDPEGCGAEKSQDFQRLLGIGHRDRGHMDLVGNRNNRTLTANTWLRVDDTLNFSIDYHFFQLHEATGKWMYNNGASVGQGWDLDNDSNNLGHELDIYLTYAPFKPLWIRPAYGIFIPDTAARRIAGSAPQHFVYVWLIAEIGRRWSN